jgi:hypothetical protein
MKHTSSEPLVAGLIFAVFGVGCYFLMFGSAFGGLPASFVAAAAAGIPGGIAWWVLYRGPRRRHAGRCFLAGLFAGVTCHPLFFLIGGALNGERISLEDLLAGWAFSLMVAGIFTIPAGLLAAGVSRIITVALEEAPPPIETDNDSKV